MSEKPSVLIVGGGIAGIQASLDLGSRGFQVYLLEETPTIGGRMAQLDKTFPTMDCSICILAPKMMECFRHPNVKLLTYSQLKEVSGSLGNFHVKILKKPRYVEETRCTGCGVCAEHCPIEVPNEFDMQLGMRKAIYMPMPQAVPRMMTVDRENCIECKLCTKVCQAGAVNFQQQPQDVDLDVGAIIIATGFDQYDPSEIVEYGYGKHRNVLTALEFERWVCASGPVGGHLLRPADGGIPKRIAFIQCVGSRGSKFGAPFCSSVCCMYATKEALIIREHAPDVNVYIFYNELRAFGKGFQEFATRARTEYGVNYIRSRPGEVKEDPQTKSLTIWYDDTLTREIKTLADVDLVVLCPALIPRESNKKLAKIIGAELDESGFFKVTHPLLAPVDSTVPGIYVCGYCQSPKDIPDSVAQASGAAARAAEALAVLQLQQSEKGGT
jgi:heterodisulfide reductase subunit A